MTLIQVTRELQGSILDIGGGGEGIIGRVYGNSVIAIDNLQEELDEAPNNCTKKIMDATNLGFANESFDNITFFYSLMYMSRQSQKEAISEAFRVLKTGGEFIIWDTVINSAYPEPFIIELDIDVNVEIIHTTYGIIKENAAQNCSTFVDLCKKHGLILQSKEDNDNTFKLGFLK